MAYVPNYDYDIFISYSHRDNQSMEGHPAWVDDFHDALRLRLTTKLGDSLAIRRDNEIGGNVPLPQAIRDACQNSALLICITSRGYFASTWCEREYEIFCSANQDPLIYENKSRIFKVILDEAPAQPHQALLNETLGYEFYKPESGLPLWKAEESYWRRIEKIVRDIDELLTLMKPVQTCRYVLVVDTLGRAFDRDHAEAYAAALRRACNTPHLRLSEFIKETNEAKLILDIPHTHINRMDDPISMTSEQQSISVRAFYPGSLDEILLQAKKRLIISGHTLNRFSQGEKVQEALNKLLRSGVRVTLIMLNPKSKYAQAHAPFYESESSGSSEEHYKETLKRLKLLFESLDEASKARLEVLLGNFMPRFRTIIVDGKTVYANLYMYEDDVNDYADFVLHRDDSPNPVDEDGLFARITSSTLKLVNAPEIVPYIRYGRLHTYWAQSNLVKWDRWTPQARYRHQITHQFYVTHAEEFHERFGGGKLKAKPLEPYVRKFLRQLRGMTVVVGCGSGKEVEYLSRKGQCAELYGVDFSPEGIKLARSEYPDINARFIVADFYDLEYIVDGKCDSIAANAAFVHLFERDDMLTILKRISNKLKPGGLCFIRNLYKEDEEGNPVNHDYFPSPDRWYDPRWFVYYSRTYLVELAKSVDLFVDDTALKDFCTKKRKMPISRNGETIDYDLIKNMDILQDKGFPHERFEGVYWPTLLLVKSKSPKATRH